MRPKILLLLLFFPFVILPQNNFIEQITNGDFDARNPFIYKNSYGLNRELFFELHKNGFSNIYSIRYNSDAKQFEDTVSLTTGTSINLNPSFKPNIGLLYQTNQNGNWDIVLLPDSDDVWKSPRFLTNSLSDEVSPRFFETMSSWEDSTRILFKRDDEIIFLSIEANTMNEEIIFQNDSNVTYNNFTGLQTDIWGVNSGYYVYAVEDSSNHKKIISRYKPFNGTWKDKTVIKDNCDCEELSIQISGYAFWGLFYSDTTSSQRRFFTIQDPFSSYLNSELVDLKPEGNLSTFDLYAMLIVGKRSHTSSVTDYPPYFPYTFIVDNESKTMVRTDLSQFGFWGKDSLVQTSVIKPKVVIGSLGDDFNLGIVVYTIWEDSIDGHIQLFGYKQYLQYGAVENESYVNDFILYQNYPNPFNPVTKIEYKLQQATEIKFLVVNVLGETVFEKSYGYQLPGNYKIDFDGAGLSSGVYLYSIFTDENKLSRKMILLK
jgi:hypothetical protein